METGGALCSKVHMQWCRLLQILRQVYTTIMKFLQKEIVQYLTAFFTGIETEEIKKCLGVVYTIGLPNQWPYTTACLRTKNSNNKPPLFLLQSGAIYKKSM